MQAPPRLDDQNHAGKVHCMSVAPDGATAVSVAADGCAMVWDVQSGNCRHTLKGHATALHWASLASDGRTLLTVAGDRMVKAWDITTGACGATLPSKLLQSLLTCHRCHILPQELFCSWIGAVAHHGAQVQLLMQKSCIECTVQVQVQVRVWQSWTSCHGPSQNQQSLLPKVQHTCHAHHQSLSYMACSWRRGKT